MPRLKPATHDARHFVVERLNWRRASGDTFYRYPGQTRIASFDTVEKAEAHRRELESVARAAVNPFLGTLAPPADQTSLPEDVLCDWLTDQDIDPPATSKSGARNWAKWWPEANESWTDEERAAVWDRLDRVIFYRVVERIKRPVVYAVVRVIWGYNDEWFYPGAEGGVTQTVYRSRQKAEQIAAELNESARAEWTEGFEDFDVGYEPAGIYQFELEGRTLPGRDPFGPEPTPTGGVDEEGDELFTFAPDEVPFFEVVEIEMEGES